MMLFGSALPVAVRYADWLAGPAVQRGLLGPGEAARVWDRHLLNCAVCAELIDAEAEVLDVGSGAGLPGIALALARPDLRVTLLEPMARRVAFLDECLRSLGLTNVTVVRGRAQAVAGQLSGDVVVARAVAPLGRLVGWCWPLVRPGGQLLALKGQTAARELERDRPGFPADVMNARVCEVGAGVVRPSAIVVRLARGDRRASDRSARGPSRRTRSSGGSGARGGRR
jgi:16S rRNA (guanine527-N7)-methyltransferase